MKKLLSLIIILLFISPLVAAQTVNFITNFTSNQLDDKSFPVIKQVRQGSAASRRIEFVIPLENNNIQKKLVGELLGKYITGYQDKFIITKDPGTLAF